MLIRIFELEGTSEISSSRPLISQRGELAQRGHATCPGHTASQDPVGPLPLAPLPARSLSLRSQTAEFCRTDCLRGGLGAAERGMGLWGLCNNLKDPSSSHPLLRPPPLPCACCPQRPLPSHRCSALWSKPRQSTCWRTTQSTRSPWRTSS